MLGITGTSLRVDAGHIMTCREHVCGEFRDTDGLTANAIDQGREPQAKRPTGAEG